MITLVQNRRKRDSRESVTGLRTDQLQAEAQSTPTKREARKNLKLEIRNSKQIQMIKGHKIPNKLLSDFDFWISDLRAEVCFGFRASDFD
jgi:hypothetical protein